MSGISIIGVDSAGGVIIGPGAGSWTVGGSSISLLGDSVAGHPPSKTPHAGSPTMVEGSGWMTIDGVPVVREGNSASCGHTATGQGWFTLPN